MKDLNKLSQLIKLDTIDEVIKPKDGEFYENLINNPNIMNSRPWKNEVKYFKKVAISSISVLKMSKHAVSGGNIEIMGMLVGKIHENTIVVNDVYGLPVEGTETRVNAQVEGYEYMVSYLTKHKLIKPNENIVGWYHSHPGYGCWLSGIDVATQSLNQNFQDPYLAIVIDPKKSLTGTIEIGAFRTFPDDYKVEQEDTKNSDQLTPAEGLNHDKIGEFGMYANKYYALDIEIFKTKNEQELIKLINKETWINELSNNKEQDNNNESIKFRNINTLNNLLFENLAKNNNRDKSHYNKSFINNQFNSIFNKFINDTPPSIKNHARNHRHHKFRNELRGDIDMTDDSEGEETLRSLRRAPMRIRGEDTFMTDAEGEGNREVEDPDTEAPTSHGYNLQDDYDDDEADDDDDEEDDDDEANDNDDNNRSHGTPKGNSDVPLDSAPSVTDASIDSTQTAFHYTKFPKLNKEVTKVNDLSKHVMSNELKRLIKLDIQRKLFS